MSQKLPKLTQLSRHARGAQQQHPVPRRVHTKSRTGCRNCKERRVKCDEKRPVCDKCTIHYDNIYQCDYGGDDAFENDSSVHKLPEKFPRKHGERSAERFRALQVETWQTQTTRSLSPSSLDPFKTHPPTKELDVSLLMDAYFSNQIFKTFPKRNPVLEFFAPLIWKDTVLFHVTLLLSVFNLMKNAPVKQRIRSKRLQADCIGLLQERINEPSPDCASDETLSAVAGLAAIEHEKGNSRLVQIHVAGLKRILAVRGGLEAVRKSNPTVANILFCIIAATAAENYPACDLDRPIDRPTRFGVSLRNEAPGSHIDFEAHGVSKEQSKIMLSIRMLAKTSQRVENCSTPLECQDVLSFMCSTLQRLLALPLPTPLGSYKSQITAACRHALVVHVFTRWCGHQPDPSLMVSMAQHDLLSVLRQLMSHRESNQMLLWLLSVCGTGFLGPAQRKWVVSQLADVLEDLEIKSWEKMLENLQQVMWHNYQDEQQRRELWEEIMWHNYQDEQQQRELWEEVMLKHEFTAQECLLGDTGRPKSEDLWLAVLR